MRCLADRQHHPLRLLARSVTWSLRPNTAALQGLASLDEVPGQPTDWLLPSPLQSQASASNWVRSHVSPCSGWSLADFSLVTLSPHLARSAPHAVRLPHPRHARPSPHPHQVPETFQQTHQVPASVQLLAMVRFSSPSSSPGGRRMGQALTKGVCTRPTAGSHTDSTSSSSPDSSSFSAFSTSSWEATTGLSTRWASSVRPSSASPPAARTKADDSILRSLGTTALGIESQLPTPQAISNFQRKSTAGLKASVIAGWLGGDLYK